MFELVSDVCEGGLDFVLPSLVRVRQDFPDDRIADVHGEIRKEMKVLARSIKPGQTVAIAVGSRGINHLSSIVKTIVDSVKSVGGIPFIVPAMGSHGGATAAGQVEILSGYGVDEANMGAPIKATMEVVELGTFDGEFPVYFDKSALEADWTIAVNRVKPHTDFQGEWESGLMKMISVGLGKHKGASLIHAMGSKGLRERMPAYARQVIKRGNILGGIALVENAYEEPAIIKALLADEIESGEKDLLEIAKNLMPSLPARDIDVLIVEEMGKEVSGAGLDPWIIGRRKIMGEPDPPGPGIKMLVVLGLTKGAHGNAVGLGLADITTGRLIESMDLRSTYVNGVTTGFLERCKIPLVMPTDREAIALAVRVACPLKPNEARIVQIKNTLQLNEVMVSGNLVPGLPGYAQVQGEAGTMTFDCSGRFVGVAT